MRESSISLRRPALHTGAAGLLLTTACLLIVVAGGAWLLFHALGLAVDLPTMHLDGAFQTASGLYRLKDGQWPGRDFMPYLGVGPLLALMPFFLAGGGDLAASVAAAHLLTQSCAVLAVAVLWHLVFAPRRAIASLAAAVVLVVGGQALPPLLGAGIPSWFDFALRPGNSLRPVRSALPYLLALGVLAASPLQGPRWARWQPAAWGALAGACVLWSNDYAYTTGLLFCVMAAMAGWRGGKRSRRALVFALAAAGMAAAAMLAATAGHPLALLRYNFVDVAGDQWWIFAPYDAEARVFGWADLPRVLLYDTRFALAVLALVAAWAGIRRSARAGLLAFTGVALFAGGAAATVGGFFSFYFGAFRFWGGMVALLLVLRALWWGGQALAARRGATDWGGPAGLGGPTGLAPLVPGVAVLAIAAGTLAIAALEQSNLRAKASEAARDPGRFFVPELGGYLPVAWREAVAHARQHPDAVLIEEYWGLWSALRGGRSPWAVDAVIHALGGMRAQAESALQRADIITSTRRSYSPDWQPWNLGQNPWFYRELLAHWEPESLTPTTIVWRRRAAPAPSPEPVPCSFHGGRWPHLVLNAPAAGLHELDLRFQLGGRGRVLLLLRNGLSPIVGGWASIDPRQGEARLPLGVAGRGSVTVPVRVLGRPSTALQSMACSARRLAPPPAEVWLPQAPVQDPIYRTDADWDRGISRHWAGFLVANGPLEQLRYQPGRIVRLPSGDERRILRAEAQGEVLHVHVDGEPWRSSDSGSPEDFWVLDADQG